MIISANTYREKIAALGLTQEAAGVLFGRTGRTGQRWAAQGPPVHVAMALEQAGGDRKALEDIAKIIVDSGS